MSRVGLFFKIMKKNFIKICLIFLIIDAVGTNFNVGAEKVSVASYDNYRLYAVKLASETHVKLFQDLEASSDSVIFYGHARHLKQEVIILVAAHKVADFDDLLKTYKVEHRVLNYNFQDIIDKNFLEVKPESTDPKELDWQHYFQLETINNWLKHKAQEYPNEVSLLNIGESFESRPTYGLKLAHNSNNKAIFIESGIHAREWIAPATATFIINELLTSQNPQIQRLAHSYNWYIFPVVNPDGYKYSFEKDRMWRKNRSLFGICRGVDLNRNFPFHWNTTGTSGDPCRYDFSGPAAASEKETQNLINFLKENTEKAQIKTFLSLHSYSQLLMFPYSHTADRVENYNDLTEIAKKAVDAIKSINGTVYRSGSIYETIYPSSGGSKDWVYGEMKIPITFTFELPGPHDYKNTFILLAPNIEPTAKEAWAAIVTIVEEAEKLNYYK